MGFPLWLLIFADDCHKSVRGKYRFWATLGSTVAKVLEGEQLLIMFDIDARTDARGQGSVDGKVLGAYGRDTLLVNDNARRLLAFSAENQLAFVRTPFFQRTRSWNLIHMPKSKIVGKVATA